MAQKKAAAAAKKPAAQNKRGPKPKQVVEEKPKEEVEPSDDESDEEQNGVNFDDGSNSEVLKILCTRAQPCAPYVQQAVDLIPRVLVSFLFSLKAEDAGNLIDSEAEEAEDDDEEEDDDDEEDDEEAEEDDEVEPGEVSKAQVEADDSDDEPAEAPIDKDGKTPATEGGIPKVRVGKIPHNTPKNRIIFVSQLPQGKWCTIN